jgi:hypothetical protein
MAPTITKRTPVEVVEARSESNEHLGLLQRFQICDPDDGERGRPC